MWLGFLLASACAVALLYVPGFLLFRGLRLGRVLSLACAPLYSVAAYAALPIAYYNLGVSCSLVSVALPVFVVGTVTYGVARVRGGLRRDRLALAPLDDVVLAGRKLPFDVVVPLLYLLVGVAVCVWVFVSSLSTPDAFFCRFDNQTHVNLVRSFVDSGKWSSLHTSVYLGSPAAMRPNVGDGGFYPAAWHVVVALVCLLVGADVTVGINAVVGVVSAVVLPLCSYAFLRAFFAGRRSPVVFGAFATTGFATCLWHLVITGPLYPNQLGLSMLFGILALVLVFVRDARQGMCSRSTILCFVLVCALAFLALAFSHPSVVFVAYVFLAAFGSSVVWGLARAWEDKKCVGKKRWRSVAMIVGYWIAIMALWALCLNAPFLRAVVSYHVGSFSGPLRMIASLPLLKFGVLPFAQVSMAVLTAVGLVAFVRSQKNLWILVPLAFFTVAYVAVYSYAEATVTHWLAGFWYNDGRRVGVVLCMFLIPLCALGASVLFRGSMREGQASGDSDQAQSDGIGGTPRLRTVGRAALVVLAILLYVPALSLPVGDGVPVSPLQAMKNKVTGCYALDDERVYGASERAFVRMVAQTLPKDALVINYAPDGSMWSYGVEGINTLFRKQNGAGQTEDAATIRKHLNEYATNPAVQKAVQNVGATYVMLLDKGVSYEDGTWLSQFKKPGMQEWAGIAKVGDNTPGFSTVLAEGDQMRLYKIERSA